jgi:hypothetical protein
MKKHVFTLLALTIAGSAMAQTPPAAVAPNIVSNISGVATEIDRSGNVLRSLRNGDVIGQGSTVSTTGSMTITSNGGACNATLSGGQSMLMSATSVCDAFRTAQAQAPRTVASGGGFGGGLFTPLNVGIGVASLAALRAVTQGTGTPAPISNN